MTKSTIYIDIEDEITTIIDKVKDSPDPIVALVLPKRASVLQSIVNMRLLKRAGTEAKKKIVLVTSESTLMPLAGAVGVYVAKTLNSKPVIPEKLDLDPTTEQVDDSEPAIDKLKPIGELAGSAAVEETIDLPEIDDELPESGKKPKKNKKLAVPSFDKFRLRFMLIGLGVLALILGWFFGFVVLPKAHITIITETETLDSEFLFSADTKATELNKADAVVPANRQEIKRVESEKFATTGEKDAGTKATGTMSLKNCRQSDGAVTVPAGTGFSSGSLTFLTDEAITLPQSVFSGGGTCLSSSESVPVTAASGGSNYNLSARSYTSSMSGIQANGSAMGGGTTKLVKAPSQADADAARDKLLALSSEQTKTDISKLLDDTGFFPISESFQATPGELKVAPKVGEEGTEATASIEFTYSMYGVQKTAMDDLLAEKQKPLIDTIKQVIADNGLKTANIKVTERVNNDVVRFSYKGTASAGASLDANAIAEEIKGKSLGETEKILKERPGVEDVRVDYSPPWVFNTPKATKKIQVTFEVPTPAPEPETSETPETTDEAP